MAAPYGGQILEHFRHPRNQGSIAGPDASEEGSNPLCGDRIRIDLAVRGGRIEEARFTANACAICIASASLLTERVLGMNIAAAAELRDDVAVSQLGAKIPEARVPCALLPLQVLRRGLATVAPASREP